MAETTLQIGVKELLDIAYHPAARARDLAAYLPGAGRAREGIAGHRLIRDRRPAAYQTEIAVQGEYRFRDLLLQVHGRIDGYWETEAGGCLEEIKTIYLPVSRLAPGQFPVHEAQLKLYLYFWMLRDPGRPARGILTYLNLDDLTERSFPLEIPLEDGRRFFEDLAGGYLEAYLDRKNWITLRNGSLRNWEFPFTETRPGQGELMEMVTLAITQERELLAEAATGIGKTIAVLYPALQQLAVNPDIARIFFLTAKTEGKEILRKTLELSRLSAGLRLRTVFIEAKGRVCFTSETNCHPEICPYAAGYYDRLDQALPALLLRELITPDLVLESARRHQLCPYELSLDLALEADLIVCDYNYLFDPGVYLHRFFMEPKKRDSLFLIDEAHNLVGRGREMYSARVGQRDFEAFATALAGFDANIDYSCSDLRKFWNLWREELDCDRENAEFSGPPAEASGQGRSALKLLGRLPEMLQPAVERLLEAIFQAMRHRPILSDPRVHQFYLILLDLNRILPLVNRDYAIYLKEESQNITLHLFCLNPGPLLRKKLILGRAAVFFSATLAPLPYFQKLLGAADDALAISLPSPFPLENRLYLHVPGIDTRYRNRNRTLEVLARSAADLALAHPGNYLIFFPSYAYLREVQPLLRSLLPRAQFHIQSPTMNTRQKRDFIRPFSQAGDNEAAPATHIGLAVLGGLFGEGIDLPGEQLIGVFIAGPGLPVVNEEQELIRAYFDEREGNGFLYAYLIPGLIRVIQSAGRVFRTPEDKGVVMLVDDRFLRDEYQELLPPDWVQPRRTFSTPDYRETLAEFWENS